MNKPGEKLNPSRIQDRMDQIVDSINQIILGKEDSVRLSLVCMIARGHLLIEDTPGVGKTILAHTLAKVMGLNYQRIQFTSDLLPADILGMSVYNRDNGKFEFHSGPVFTQVLLADEINRATPRTQSALLEAMAEYQVTIEGETRTLPQPFFVIATQNPISQIGTFQLPESQLDRFLMRLRLGYPDNAAERELLQGEDRRKLLTKIAAVIEADELVALQDHAETIHVADPLLDYIQALLECSRDSNEFYNGLSPRAGLAILHSARAWALVHGHEYVMPEDVQAILPSVIEHRLFSRNAAVENPPDPATNLIKQVPVP